MKRKLITTILTLSLCLSCFTACSFNAKKVSDNIGKGNESDLPEAEDVVIDDKDDMYNIGDEIDVKTVEYGTDREYIEKCYTVNSVKLYDTAAEVDGVSDNLIEIDFHVIISYGVSIAAVADNLIENVKYKVSEFTGLEIKKINIYVEGVRVID